MSKMIGYCLECGDKIEIFPLVGEITNFSDEKIEFDKIPLGFCDNEDCKFFGIVVIRCKNKKSHG